MKFDVFLDSDGVLADFSKYCLLHYGKLPDGLSGKEKARFWQWVGMRNTVEPFFESLPKMDGADELVEFCLSNFKSVTILTASGNIPSDSAAQKIRWYEREFPGLSVIVVTKSLDKSAYASPSSILVDDRFKALDPWIEAGGVGILHTSVSDTIEQLNTYR